MDLPEIIKTPLEDIVIIVAIALGLVGGVVLLFLDIQPVVPAIFFSMAIAGFTYRFLGGIDERTSFTIGALKLTGTAAMLLGSLWLIDYRLVREQGTQTYAIPDDFRPEQIYLFDTYGEPVSRTVHKIDGNDTTELTFVLPATDLFKNRAGRLLQREQNRLYILTQSDSIYLGFIDAGDDAITRRVLSPKRILDLGIYYSQISDRDSKARIDPDTGIDLLIEILTRDDTDDGQKKTALQQLYYLQPFFNEAREFQVLLENTQKYRSGYFMHLELAEIHLAYSQKIPIARKEQQVAALIHFLSYLGTPQSENDKRRQRDVTANVQELVQISLAQEPAISGIRTALLRALNQHDRSEILRLRDQISAEMVAEK